MVHIASFSRKQPWTRGSEFKYILFCFILLFTSSSPCRKDQFVVLYFSTSLIVQIQVYNRVIRHHSLVCYCGFADILNIMDWSWAGLGQARGEVLYGNN